MRSIITPPPRYSGDAKLSHLVVSQSKPGPSMTAILQEPTPPHVKPEEELDRGRPRSRSQDKDSNSDDIGGDGDANGENSSNSDGGPSRKRRRSRKGLDKKFECPHIGCGKSYSRAEHLYAYPAWFLSLVASLLRCFAASLFSCSVVPLFLSFYLSRLLACSVPKALPYHSDHSLAQTSPPAEPHAQADLHVRLSRL